MKPLDINKVNKSKTDLKIILTEAKTGKYTYLSTNNDDFDLLKAIKASCAYPGFYYPQVKINGKDVTDLIRSPAVTALVSKVAAQKAVRQVLVGLQQQLGRSGGVVAEGRDIGSNVFPDAELKIFLTASVQERARRRWQEFQAQGHRDISPQKLEADIAHRDRLDSQRRFAPLKQAPDAIAISTDGMSVEAVIEQIIQLYRERGLGR